MPRQLHIISFDVPFPPNYGGVIDVYYKIKALHQLGVSITLHTYKYGRAETKELEKICSKVYYYKRNLSITNVVSKIPFIVKSRSNKTLLENLKATNAPILFEGLHTTFPLLKNTFIKQKIIIRTHNIEHDYYAGLAKSETALPKKIFLKAEATKLKKYESILTKSDFVFTISPFEQAYFSKKYNTKSIYIPVFHQSTTVKTLSSKGDFALYHGDLRVSDNIKAIRFLMDIFTTIDYPLVIASSFKNNALQKKIESQKNTKFIDITSQKVIENLLEKAHVNILPTFQKTGIKLKLLNTLFNSRFTIANDEMIEDTGLEPLCICANSKLEFNQAILKLIKTKYSAQEVDKKKQYLSAFSPLKSAQKIIDILY